MADDIFYWLAFLQNEFLIFSICIFFLFAVDELVIDIIWLARRFRSPNSLHEPGRRPTMAALLPPRNSGRMAIFVPTWKEAAVIEQMLDHCHIAWADGPVEYMIYTGYYANDRDGYHALWRAASRNPAVRLVRVEHDGPTTKADCLNHLWSALLEDEKREEIRYKAVILHDAEDQVDREELRLFDRLIEEYDAVQLPVIPVIVPGSLWVSGHYLDEFADSHGRVLPVRALLGAAIPFAGVGVAIDRQALGQIAYCHGGDPFDASSLTEDYELGLQLAALGGKSLFARYHDDAGRLVGTRACFPDDYGAAVRQKTRWITGIALAGWDRMGWGRGWSEKWMRLRDRRTMISAFSVTLAYLGAGIAAMILPWSQTGEGGREPFSPLVISLLMFNIAMLFWRLAFRGFLVGREYGAKQGLLSFPRVIMANIIFIAASRRAFSTYAKYCLGAALSWDKTARRHFPASGR